jgi:DNA-binding YbaB/EbfC family protein
MFKGLSNLGALLKQAQQIGGKMQQLGEELKQRRSKGTAGGEMVEVEVNGLLEVLTCRINEQLVREGDRELIEDLLVAAVNSAIAKAKQQHAEAMKRLTGGIELPGAEDLLAKFLGEPAAETPAADSPPGKPPETA